MFCILCTGLALWNMVWRNACSLLHYTSSSAYFIEHNATFISKCIYKVEKQNLDASCCWMYTHARTHGTHTVHTTGCQIGQVILKLDDWTITAKPSSSSLHSAHAWPIMLHGSALIQPGGRCMPMVFNRLLAITFDLFTVVQMFCNFSFFPPPPI